jgi:pimeloyl-ACP methyl ester carboxylesterase
VLRALGLFCSAAVAVASIAYFLSGWIFYRIAVARTRKKFLDDDPSLPPSVAAKDEELLAWWDAQEKREVRISGFGGLNLVADYLPDPKPNKLVVVLVHGYTGTGPSMKRYARLFRERFDCDILCPDLRGHGRSDGKYIGFGLHDSLDLRLWLGKITELRGAEARIVLFGVSMGASTVLMTASDSAQGTRPNIACAISDCGYSDARDILAYKLKKLYRLPRFPFLNAVSLFTRVIAGYELREASPIDAVARSSVPLLFIHGDADVFVPVDMGRALYAAARSEKKELYIVPDAGHAESYNIAGKNYAERVSRFVSSALS